MKSVSSFCQIPTKPRTTALRKCRPNAHAQKPTQGGTFVKPNVLGNQNQLIGNQRVTIDQQNVRTNY